MTQTKTFQNDFHFGDELLSLDMTNDGAVDHFLNDDYSGANPTSDSLSFGNRELANQPQRPASLRTLNFSEHNMTHSPRPYSNARDLPPVAIPERRNTTKRTRGAEAEQNGPAEYVVTSPNPPSPPAPFDTMSTQQAPYMPALPAVEEITEIAVDRSLHEGFMEIGAFSVRRQMERLQQKDIERLELGLPAVQGNTIVVAGNQGRGQPSYLMQINPILLNQTPPLGFNPISRYHEVPLPVQSVVWENDNTLVCAMGDQNHGSRIQKYHLSREGRLSTNLDYSFAHLDVPNLRDIKVHNSTIIAASGNNLHIIDERGNQSSASVEGKDVCSIKSTLGCGPSIATEDGKVLIFDSRASWTQPATVLDSGCSERIFAHEFYTEMNVLMGGLNGKLTELDLRSGRVLGTVRDPYVFHIGDIEYNQQSRCFVTSGMGDFSFWKHAQHRARIWAHRQASDLRVVLKRGQKLDMFATFASPNVVISTTTEGFMGIHFEG